MVKLIGELVDTTKKLHFFGDQYPSEKPVKAIGDEFMADLPAS